MDTKGKHKCISKGRLDYIVLTSNPKISGFGPAKLFFFFPWHHNLARESYLIVRCPSWWSSHYPKHWKDDAKRKELFGVRIKCSGSEVTLWLSLTIHGPALATRPRSNGRGPDSAIYQLPEMRARKIWWTALITKASLYSEIIPVLLLSFHFHFPKFNLFMDLSRSMKELVN